MALYGGSSNKTISKNIKKLVGEPAGKTRKKGIKTLAKRRGISEKEAKRKQAIAISYSKAGR